MGCMYIGLSGLHEWRMDGHTTFRLGFTCSIFLVSSFAKLLFT